MGLCQHAGGDGGGEQGQYAAYFPGHALPVHPVLFLSVLECRPGGSFPLNELLPDDVLLYDVPVRLLDDLLHGRVPFGLV